MLSGMAPKKGKRRSVLPAKLNEFLCEDTIKENEPRRSGRTPKITEKLKLFMDDQGVIKDEDEVEPNIRVKRHQSSGSPVQQQTVTAKYKEPKVILKALPKSVLLKEPKTLPGNKREGRVLLKRLGSTKGGINTRKGLASKLRVQKTPLRRPVTAKSKATLQSNLERELKIALDDIYSDEEEEEEEPEPEPELQPARRGKRKRASVEEEDLQPKGKSKRTNLRVSERKGQEKKTKDSQFDPEVMKKLFNFGAKVEEVLVLNKEAVNRLTKYCNKDRSLSDMLGEKLENINEGDVDKVLKWLEEEERHRKEHQEKVMDSLRVSHKTNIALYSHMLTLLQSVTASV